MTEKPWLSAIVPSHNGERWLASTLDSVAAQHDPGIEVIIIDSSDTGESLEIVARFADRLTVRSYRRPDLTSWMGKTNCGVEMAAAEWVCMLHQDDIWMAGRAAEIRKWIARRPGAVMHLHPAHIIDNAGKRLGLWRCPLPSDGRPVPPELFLERLLVQNFIAIPTPTIRRDAYLKVAGLDEHLWYTADWDLYLKLLFAGDIYYHPVPLACFRVHGNSLTMSGSRGIDDFRRQMEIVRDRYIDQLTSGRDETRRIASASIAVNVALAAAGNGHPGRLAGALASLLALGPRKLVRYFHHSRIIERAYPRLRARLAGGL